MPTALVKLEAPFLPVFGVSLNCVFVANICLCVSGTLPQFLQEKVSAMMGCESGGLSPNHDEVEDLDLNSGMKKKRRRSFGGKALHPPL